MPLCNKQLHEMSIENTYVSPAWLKVCRACSREYHRKHRANNIESHRRRQRKWKKNNPEKVSDSPAEKIQILQKYPDIRGDVICPECGHELE